MKLEVRGLNVAYRTAVGSVQAVRDCDLSVERGELAALVGESGSGKSSVVMAIPRLLPASARVSGSVLCDGTDLTALGEPEMNRWRWKRLSLVPQGAGTAFSPHLSVGAHFREVLARHERLEGRSARERTGALLGDVGLDSSFARRYPHELSGGQKQRAALALALACDPDFLLADEPTTALDVVTQKEVMTLIADRVRSQGLGLLLVTHDLPLASEFCDRLFVMKDGQIVESGPASRVVDAPLHPYTRALLDALELKQAPAHSGERRAGTGRDES